jgi:hypothetical protein
MSDSAAVKLRRQIIYVSMSLAAMIALGFAAQSRAGSIWIWVCGTWTNDAGVMQASPGHGYSVTAADCGRRGLVTKAVSLSHRGDRAGWKTSAPTGLEFVGAWVPPHGLSVRDVNDGAGYGGGFYWKGGTAQAHSNATTWSSPRFISPYFGWQMACARRTCSGYPALVTVYALELHAIETRAPTIIPAGPGDLFSQSGWVRGSWPIAFHTSDPTGVCQTYALAAGHLIYGPSVAPNNRVWHQCPDQNYYEQVNTADVVPQGAGTFPLTLSASNAAYVSTSKAAWTKTVSVDNVTPTISLSGPSDAASTAGAQYINATAAAGPSGIASISCSLDSAPPHSVAGASARIPVTGIGLHRVTCVAINNAKDAHGNPAVSAPAVHLISIRQPTVTTVSFVRIADALRCAKEHERVTIPAQWIFEKIHGKRVRVRIPAQTRTITVERCHPRVVKRRVRRHGHWVLKKVVLLPRQVLARSKRVAFGSPATVSGWLGTTGGTALPGQRVTVLTAPDDGSQTFTTAATTTTRADGSWSIRLRPGPSRLVRAVYSGGATVEPTTSEVAHLVVPASVSLSLKPNHTRWGHTITISGLLRGGHIPPSGELVVLRIGWRGGSTEIGHLYAKPSGHFGSTYTFLRGNGTETYHLWASTAHETDYPFAPGSSRRVAVTVGP